MDASVTLLLKRIESTAPGVPLVEYEQELIQLKRYSRALHDESSVAREKLIHVLKLQTEQCQLALQSCECEREYYEKELPTCLSTPVFDRIQFAHKQEEATTTTWAKTMESKLTRVNQEISTRKQLTQEIAELTKQLELTNQDLLHHQTLLEGCPSKLVEVENTLAAFQSFLDSTPLTTKRLKQ